ncbi:MAG: ACT domain-containing protein, partial [Candidatus Limnocylindria bacterium]
LITRHRDQPGIVGAVGSALAAAGVNISSLELSRLSAAGEAMMFVSVDQTIPDEVLDGLRAVAGMIHAQVVQLPA